GNNRIFANGGIAAGLAQVGLSGYAGNDGQAPDPVFASSAQDPNQPVIGYSGTAYVTGTPMQLGSSPVLPDIQFEVTGFLAGTAGPTYTNDASPARIIVDFLTSPRYGAGFPSALLDEAGSIADYGTYCQAAFLGMSLVMDRQQAAARWLDEITKLSNAAVVWAGTLLKIIPYGDQTLAQNGTTWTPDLVWQAALDDDDFLPQEHSEGRTPVENATDPVTLDLSDPQTLHNWLPVEYDDGANSYNPQIVPAFDQGSIDQFGLKLKPSLVAHEFTNPNSAVTSGALALQRELQIRARVKFKLGWQHCLLEPMDIVLVTDSGAGLAQQPFRVTGYEEDDNGDLSFDAEEIP
ncbi:MAG: phage tail protein, partial [Stellaceae bacterium]